MIIEIEAKFIIPVTELKVPPELKVK